MVLDPLPDTIKQLILLCLINGSTVGKFLKNKLAKGENV